MDSGIISMDINVGDGPSNIGEQSMVQSQELEGSKSVTGTSVLNKTEETIVEAGNTKKKILNIEAAENVPKDFAAYLNESSDASVPDENPLKSAPTSVIVTPKPSESPKENGEKINGNSADTVLELEASESGAPPVVEKVTTERDLKKVLPEGTEPTITVADLVEEAEKKEEPPSAPPEKMVESNADNQLAGSVENPTDSNVLKESKPMKVIESETKETPIKSTEKVEAPIIKSPMKRPIPESPSKPVKAADLVQEWDDDDMEEEEESANSQGVDSSKKATDSADENSASDDKLEDFTPRKSSRAPKPTEKKLASEQQENLKPEEMDEESVDAIAKELEKPDSELKKTGKKDLKSPRKGKKGPGETKEDWVTLIFGENGEKVTEKGRKKGEVKEGKSDADVPEAEEFLIDQTPFQSEKSKRGGRPRKKDLDEKLDGVAKLGSNMYFYTGPGGNKGGRESPNSLHSDDEEMGKSQSDSVRKSGRAGKGKNPRLDREDEFVELPQAKAKEASLNPSWLKNHDGKTPASSKKGQATIPITPVTSKSSSQAPTTPATSKSTSQAQKKSKDPVMEAAAEEIASAMEHQTAEEARNHALKGDDGTLKDDKRLMNSKQYPKLAEMDKELPEFDPTKFTPGQAPKTVKKGEDEYVIVVSGVADTGLCGKYWGDLTNLPSRRRSKAPETLQLGNTPGKEEAAASPVLRRGSVGSTSSTETPPVSKKMPATKRAGSATKEAVKETPKSGKKQAKEKEKKAPVVKPEPESSMSESEPEEQEPQVTASTKPTKGRKRKASGEPQRKEKKVKSTSEETEEQKGFSDYDSAGAEQSPLRGISKSSKDQGQGENGGVAPQVTSNQQKAVNAALAAGVPAGQQRSVSCVADTSTQREVVVECFAPYDDHRWVNIGKERDGMAPDAVQYARALRPPYHLLSFLRIKGHSTKGMSCTDKNTMVFVVLEGEITVILHTTQFNAKKGDSFYIPPKNYYNLINQKAREAELSLIQFQYDGPLPTVQPSSS